MTKELDINSTHLPHSDTKLSDIDTGLRANKSTYIGRKHVETEESLNSVLDFPKVPFEVENFVTGEHGIAQFLSADESTGESTQRVILKKGWNAPIGHFTADVEVFVLTGELRQGGFELSTLNYSNIPAGIPTGPWKAQEDTVLLWMPDKTLAYVTEDYANLEQIPENSAYHVNIQSQERMTDHVPTQEFNAMKWASTPF